MRIKMKWNRKYASVLAGVVLVAVTVSSIGYRVAAADTDGNKAENEQDTTQEEFGKSFTEEGTTQIKTDSQNPNFSVGAVTMTVEEVYVESGTTVEEGTALLKITDESMEDAIAYYEDEIEDARDALTTAQIELESGMLEAGYELQDTELLAETAQSSYDAAVSELAVSVDEKKEAYDDVVDEIDLYQEALDNGTYYVQVGAEEKQAAVDAATVAVTDAQAALTTAQSNYDAAQTAITTDMENLKSQIAENVSYETLQMLADQVAADYVNVQTAAADLAEKQVAADTAQSTLEKATLTLENAGKEYNTLVQTANDKLAELYGGLEELQEAYEQAERDAVTAQAQIQKEYDEAVLAGTYAGTEYESTIAALAETVETAQETLEELLEEQEALLALEDGVICADRAGTVAAVSYEAEDVLQDNLALVSYYDMDTIYISVEVAQEQIALLTVKDEVEVSISGSRETVAGEIASIAAEKSSGGSVSNVTYAVVIAIDNSDGNLSSGSSATVLFDYEEDITEGAE